MPLGMEARSLFTVGGLVAVITGGGTGIGLMMAKALSINGASAIYLLGIDTDSILAAAQEIANTHPITCDVTSKASLQEAVDLIALSHGYINLLICNAGIPPAPVVAPEPDALSSIKDIRNYFFNATPAEDHGNILAVNVTGVLLTTFAFLELLDEGNKRDGGGDRPSSQVITISSAGAFDRGAAFVYNASKAGVLHMMRGVATYLAPWRIRSNIVAPGLFHSQITAELSKQFDATNGEIPRELVPQGRFGNEAEIAGTILYLASKAGGYCNGSVMLVDGGVMSVQPSSY